jgi:hypothetical protein
MEEVERQRQVGVELRRYPRYRVSAPFPCAFSLLGLKRWTAVDRNGLGVVLDVSLRGAKVMSTAVMKPSVTPGPTGGPAPSDPRLTRRK